MQSVVRHLGGDLEVCTNYPDVFRSLTVKLSPFRKTNIQILAHYSMRKGIPGTTQFEDVCYTAGVREPVELRLDWVGRDVGIKGPFLCVQLPRTPMGRTDGFGKEILPDCRVIQRLIDKAKDRYTIVQIGSGHPLYRFTGIDVDLSNKTTVAELIDVVKASDACLGYPSFIVPLAESLDKPVTVVWSRRGLKAAHEYVRRITPAKVLHKKSSRYLIDDATEEQIAACVL
jgi:hypothetical protein